jgi:transcriptional regulator with XRE-family HTH domain
MCCKLLKRSIYVSLWSERKICDFLDEVSVILEQLRKRRKELGLLQKDMLLKVGMTRQQYNRLEKKGNPRLDTLELLAKGLDVELMLIPREMLSSVQELLQGRAKIIEAGEHFQENSDLVDDPWQNILEEKD